MSWISKFLLTVIIPILSALFALAMFEFFLIYDNHYIIPERNYVEIEKINYGFIDKSGLSFFSESDSETSDLFVVGDSFAEGVHCASKKLDFPARLQAHLDGKFKVHNLGVVGKNLADYVDIVSNLKLDQSDTVLIVLYDNDIHISNKNCEQIRRQTQFSDLYVPNFCNSPIEKDIDKTNFGFLQQMNNQIKHLKTVQLIKETVVNFPLFSKYFYRSEYQARWNKFDSEEAKWIISSIVLLDRIVKTSGADIKFTYYPNTNAINNLDPRHLIWTEFISEVSKKTGINIDDPYPYFITNASSDSMVWSLTDKHPSCEAHDIMARHISNSVIR